MITRAHLAAPARARLIIALTMLIALLSAAFAAAAQAAPVAQFNRETYNYSTTLTTSQEASRYQAMVLQATDYARVPQLKAANPNLKIFMYMDTLLSLPTDTAGWTTCTPYGTDNSSHPDWFMLDQNGNRIQDKSYPGDYIMDVGNVSYQQACMAHANALAKQYGFDGVYLDDLTANLAWALPAGVSVPEYPTVSSWQSADYALVSYAGQQAHANGLLVVGNIGGSVITSGLWAQWSTPLDGAEEESFAESSMHYYWPNQLANAAWSEAHGKLSILHSHDTTETGNTFGLATMMLAAQGEDSWSTANANYTSSEAWYPEYDTAQALGVPTAAYTKMSNGVYERTFANGVVLVNPSGNTPSVNLGSGTYSGSGLTSVSSVTMSPWSGLILLADNTTSGNSSTTSAPTNTAAPSISGSAVQGQTLTAVAGTWSGTPAPTYSYQWSRCSSTSLTSCTAIAGATGSTYVVQPADVGQYLDVAVTGTNSAGTAQASSATSAQVPTPTFSLSASPTSQSIRHGHSAIYTITVVSHNGFTGAVALSVSGLPKGATANFSSSSTTSSSTLTVSTTSASIGTSTMTVSGTSGSQAGTLALGLTVK